MHIAPYDNQNQAIIGTDHPLVPLVYFNIVKLVQGESFTSHVRRYETCVVPASGTVDVHTAGETRGGSAYLNRCRAFLKWISASVMLPPLPA